MLDTLWRLWHDPPQDDDSGHPEQDLSAKASHFWNGGKAVMNRRNAWTWLVLAAFLAAAGLAIAATAPDTVTLDKAKQKQGPVVFPHQAHAVGQKIECKTCHHKDADPAKAVQSCYACHKATKTDLGTRCKTCCSCHKSSYKDKTPDAKPAFHSLCKGCHKTQKQAKAPTKCVECHQKASP
jgi:hypothetical protein